MMRLCRVWVVVVALGACGGGGSGPAPDTEHRDEGGVDAGDTSSPLDGQVAETDLGNPSDVHPDALAEDTAPTDQQSADLVGVDSCGDIVERDDEAGTGDGLDDASAGADAVETMDAEDDGQTSADIDVGEGQGDGQSDGAVDAADTAGQDEADSGTVIDTDGDLVPDGQDNCPLLYNPDQTDCDQDGAGAACDDEDDADGVADDIDNCPCLPNLDQADLDQDGLGDPCDPDDDGDGFADTVDNCIDTVNPSQADVDEDLVGDLCDEVITLPASLSFGVTGPGVEGDARGGSVALIFTGSCAVECGATGIFVLDEQGDSAVLPTWAAPDGQAEPPFVGAGGEVLFSVTGQEGVRVLSVFGGIPTEPDLGLAAAPVLLDAPGGSTLLQAVFSAPQDAESSQGIFLLSGATPEVPLPDKVAMGFAGTSGLPGPVLGADAVLYFPYEDGDGGLGLTAFDGGGAVDLIVPEGAELSLVSTALGNPVFCRRAAGAGSVQIEFWAGALPSPALELPVCPSQAVMDGTGAGLWLFFESGGAKARHWDPETPTNGPEISLGGNAQFLLAGGQPYLREQCGADCWSYTRVDPASGAISEAIPVGTFYAKKEALSAEGSLAVVSRQNKAGPGALNLTLAKGGQSWAATVDPCSSSPAQVLDLWFAPDGVLWIHYACPDTKLASARVEPGGGGLQIKPQITTAGHAEFLALGTTALVGVDGSGSGVWALDGDTMGQLASGTGDVTPVFPPDDAPDGEYSWVAYAKGSSSDWAVARIHDGDPPTSVEMLSGLAGPPTEPRRVPATAVSGFKYADQEGRESYVLIEGGEPSWLVKDVPVLVVVDRRPASVPDLCPSDAKEPSPWGVRYQAEQPGPWTFCSFPPQGQCWELPTEGTLVWSAVDPDGRVFGVLATGGSYLLWRSLQASD